MKPSFLQLESICFRKILVEAQPNPWPEAEIKISDSVELFQDETDTCRWRIELKLDILPSDDEHLPSYTGALHLSGVFFVVGELAENTMTNLVRINGCSILYSAAREMFANATARGPHPLQLLPGRSFIDLKVEEHKQNATKEEPEEKA